MSDAKPLVITHFTENTSETDHYAYESMIDRIHTSNMAVPSRLTATSELDPAHLNGERRNFEAHHMPVFTAAPPAAHQYDHTLLMAPSNHMPRLPPQLARTQPQLNVQSQAHVQLQSHAQLQSHVRLQSHVQSQSHVQPQPHVQSLPHLQSQPHEQPQPQVQPRQAQPSTDHVITREMVCGRIWALLRDNLTSWWSDNSAAMKCVTDRMNHDLLCMNKRLALGPKGLSSVSDIFCSIGHQGIYHYMCLAVNPGWGNVVILLKGELCDLEGRDPMRDKEAMQVCSEGFSKEAMKVFQNAVADTQRRQNR
ncbi:hypothetical protein PtrSN002B_010902 [Pyrenophora tritici-repentis]|uniref:ZipA, Cell division protein n=2 Tax=Pyrenophora tritici-repentis TaxID=45151 RepID=A0A2W1H382_9PLEO|nr:uncharacterized protein PTRG_05980 [Pyrenophora tritici-repentis Pt-1C-BFP]KAA8619106.1 hypothetical protein PtrV1_08535 [Pyrenophora tritici-repentis]EDU48900.1 predicted protein [Pyrenophora tritici-repentis Pt-1C-BFP]KAF7449572.1 hypothetical protein A1F99_066210 [Pyrenophora tritici-repentis]KAF7570309.1 ZipA, Cell division protein [Pyrenophora tritici-repentis]KAI0570201.1 hypothetical protein Alg130_11323 [Pyrenophora tritici-repentis]